MKKTPLLIATTNKHKIKEILSFLGDLPFKFLTLADLKNPIKAPVETGATLEENAILKARYYGQKTGLITLADDTGLFINALNGFPGIKSARIGKTADSRNKKILTLLNNKNNRQAIFKNAVAVYDPNVETTHCLTGECAGEILKKESIPGDTFGYDPIFYVPATKKTYAQMSLVEKNAISHRGRALSKTKYLLQNIYGAKHIVVPVALIVKNGQLFLTKRNDPHRPKYHNKWEFPGGSMEMGERVEQNLIREAKEETGYTIKPLEQLRPIYIKEQQYSTFAYQVYLIPYLCAAVKGSGKFNDAEVLETRWVDPDKTGKLDFVGENRIMYAKFLPELKKLIKKYKLL